MEENVRLNLIGITYNQIESGVYALILEEPASGMRLAIVVGYPEAQSIECRLQNVKTPRPLTHDLMVNLLGELGGVLRRVDIHRLPSGPFAGKLTIETVFGKIIEVDARSSDAIAIAIRAGAPIFTTRALLEKDGFVPNAKPARKQRPAPKEEKSAGGLESLSVSQLEESLEKLVSEEKYEEAAKIKRELDRRKDSGNPQ